MSKVSDFLFLNLLYIKRKSDFYPEVVNPAYDFIEGVVVIGQCSGCDHALFLYSWISTLLMWIFSTLHAHFYNRENKTLLRFFYVNISFLVI